MRDGTQGQRQERITGITIALVRQALGGLVRRSNPAEVSGKLWVLTRRMTFKR
jgi:hypothetical protein